MIGKANSIKTKLVVPYWESVFGTLTLRKLDRVINEELEKLGDAQVVDIQYKYQVFTNGEGVAEEYETALIIYRINE
ncbi:sporulation protein Cse60 [Paenibacillus sp. FSL R5-0713]|uniref:sporulation protein Cse60 n=1 Tax=Paenibacillus sp. FSL R5-0713 TaxID=2921655 RepID=UPI0030DBFA9E